MAPAPAPGVTADPLFLSLQAALAGRYSLERELGRGGMGIVYLAHEVRLDRPVAIKLLPPELAVQQRLRERFLREARTAARLTHPNIVPIYTVDEVAGFVFYAMAYVEGETAGDRVSASGPMPVREALRVLREVALALDYAHERGVVHRDVKPANMLLERGSARALIADFGIAQVTRETGDTADGHVIGSPHFMSPEQASGEPVDGRSDLYSLGAVAYYLLSGRLPFEAPSAAKILALHLTAPAPDLATVAPRLPLRLTQIVSRCLAKDPSARYATGNELAQALAMEEQRRPGGALTSFIAESETRSGLRIFSTILLAGLLADFLFFLAVLGARFRAGATGPGAWPPGERWLTSCSFQSPC